MTEASIPHLFIDFATVDRVTHPMGCHCGRCDLDGISYGISIFDVHTFPRLSGFFDQSHPLISLMHYGSVTQMYPLPE